jgi:hypothetical protein
MGDLDVHPLTTSTTAADTMPRANTTLPILRTAWRRLGEPWASEPHKNAGATTIVVASKRTAWTLALFPAAAGVSGSSASRSGYSFRASASRRPMSNPTSDRERSSR